MHTLKAPDGSEIREILGAGTAGPGKTFVLKHDCIISQAQDEHIRCLAGDGRRDHPHPLHWGESVGWGLFLRRTTTALPQVIAHIRQVYKAWDPGGKWYQSAGGAAGTFVFSSGYRMQFGHCKDEGSVEQYIGNEYTAIYWDELIHFLEEQYTLINSRLRTSDPVLRHKLRIRAASNPVLMRQKGEDFAVRDPKWVKRRFVDPAPEGNVIHEEEVEYDGQKWTRTLLYMPARLTDNPDKQFQEQYKRELVFLPPYLRQALLEGDWDVVLGGYIEHVWDPNVHIVDDFRIPKQWKRWVAMDWGFKTRGVVLWFAIDDDDTVYVYRELTFRLKHVDWVAERVKYKGEREGTWYRGQSCLPGWADTQIWEERGDTGLTKQAEFRRRGIPWRQADKKSRATNAQRVVRRLGQRGARGVRPGLVFFRSCRETLRTIVGIQADPDDPETPIKGGEDHHWDTLTYGIAPASKGQQGIPDWNARKRALDDTREESAPSELGRDGYGAA